ncbi:MAG: DUF5830 family protein, partial [Haloferacaceae archaeon]
MDRRADDDRDSEPAAAGDPESAAAAARVDREQRIELALDLLAHLEHDELELSAVVDRIETVTTEPTLTRTILDEAEKRGILEREDGRL